MRLRRSELERLRDAKIKRPFYRLKSLASVGHEFIHPSCGPSSYALVRFECHPAEDLSFESRVEWPSQALGEQSRLEIAIAEAIADQLLAGTYQHRGCTVVLTDVGYNAVGSSEAAFMKAAERAMQELLERQRDWELVTSRESA